MSERYSVVVVGGGMVGALTALALARCDLSVAVVEKTQPKPYSADNNYDIRVSAISHASLEMLKALGAWPAIEAARVCPYRSMLVWDDRTSAKTQFNSSEIGFPQLGYIVENQLIQHALWQLLVDDDNVTLMCPASVDQLELSDECAKVTLNTGVMVTSDLVVAADGSNSRIRELASIGLEGEQYDQHALVATIETELPQQDITWQRFTKDGPQAFLPLEGNRASMVWYHSAERVQELKALSEESFIDAMTAEFPQRLGGIKKVESRASFPLQWSHAKDYVKNRLALVGDAAHAVHPLAGQGVNLGLLDAAALVQCVADGLGEGRHVGSLRTLRRYQRWRRPANAVMIKMLDTIQLAFQPEDRSSLPANVPIVESVRAILFNLANNVGAVNRLCMRSAMGLTGDLPDLARGRLPVAESANATGVVQR